MEILMIYAFILIFVFICSYFLFFCWIFLFFCLIFLVLLNHSNYLFFPSLIVFLFGFNIFFFFFL